MCVCVCVCVCVCGSVVKDGGKQVSSQELRKNDKDPLANNRGGDVFANARTSTHWQVQGHMQSRYSCAQDDGCRSHMLIPRRTITRISSTPGHCALGRPMKEVAWPIVTTNVYVVLAWIALVATLPEGTW